MDFGKTLGEAINNKLQSHLSRLPTIVFCDRNDDGKFQRFAGLARVRWELESHHQKTDSYPSILILGLFPLAASVVSSQERGLVALLKWAGIAYLPYGFTSDELIAAADKAVKGGQAPLPPDLLPTNEDILRAIAEVRHWLENRLRNTQGTLIDFRNTLKLGIELHSEHMQPMMAMTEAHRQMLERLWVLTGPIERAPENARLTLKEAVDDFDTCWQRLEVVREQLRLSSAGVRKKLLGEACHEIEHVRSALAVAIDAANRLSKEITMNSGR